MKHSSLSVIEWILLFLVALRPSLDVLTDAALISGPVSLNPAGILGLALIGLGALWVLGLPTQERNSILLNPLTIPLLVWLGLLLPWAVLPFWTLDTAQLSGLREWVRLLSYLPVAMLGVRLGLKRNWSVLFITLSAGFILPALSGVYQILFQQGLEVRGVQRITGTFVHPNPFAFYLVLMAALAYGLWRMNPSRWLRLAFLLATIGLLIATFSFTGAAMFAVLLLFLAIGESAQLRFWALLAVVFFGVIFIATPQGRQRLYQVSQLDPLDEIERTGKETSSLTWRLLNWRYLYREWKKRPLLGYGLGSSQFVNPNFNVYEQTGHQPHNDYVRFLLETGAIGLILFLALLGRVGWLLWRAWRQAASSIHQRWAWLALAVYATWLTGSLADNVITATAYQYTLWLALAGAACLCYHVETGEDA